MIRLLAIGAAVCTLLPAGSPPHGETGLASWYGYPYHGRRAAVGEIYDMETMTAAHRTLPFRTTVRVHNLENGRSVDVRIMDRGPYIDGRIIDLSHAAANAIGLVAPGTAMVELEIIEGAETLGAAALRAAGPGGPAQTRRSAPPYAVQVAAFRVRENAEQYRARAEAQWGGGRIVQPPDDPFLWRVVVPCAGEQAARDLAMRIRRESGSPTAFLVKLDASISVQSN